MVAEEFAGDASVDCDTILVFPPPPVVVAAECDESMVLKIGTDDDC